MDRSHKCVQGLQESIAKIISKIAKVLQKLWLNLHKFTHGLLIGWTGHINVMSNILWALWTESCFHA